MKTLKEKQYLFTIVLRSKFGTEVTLDTYEYSFYQAYTTAKLYADKRYREFGIELDIVKIWNRCYSSG